MPAPTVAVTVDLNAMGGPAIAGVKVMAILDKNEVYSGFVVSRLVVGTTDDTGVAVLNLFPNAPSPTGLGTQGSTYTVRAAIPNSKPLNVKARIPNSACNLHDNLVSETSAPVSVPTWSSQITHQSAGASAIALPLRSYLRYRPVTPQEYGAAADGVHVDVQAIRDAFAASKTVRFTKGIYNFGNIGANGTLVDLTSLGDGIVFEMDDGSELLCNTTDGTLTAFFLLERNNHFTVAGSARFRDTGYTAASAPVGGAIGLLCTNYAGHSWGDLNIDALCGNRVVAPILFDGVVSATDRIRSGRIGKIFADDCYYGFNAQDQADGFEIGLINGYQCYRAFYVYGVTNHQVELIDNRAPRSTTGSVNIARSDGGQPTRGVRVNYKERDNAESTTTGHVLIDHFGPSLGEISDIDVQYAIDDQASTAPPVKFAAYTGVGGSETGATLGNVVDQISLGGSYKGLGSGAVVCTAAYTTPGRLHWRGGSGSSLDPSIPAQFNLTDTKTASCTWSSASNPQPTLGSGSLSVTQTVVDGICKISGVLVIGDGSLGTGPWSFSTQYKSKAFKLGVANAVHAGGYYNGVAQIQNGGNQIQLFINLPGGPASGAAVQAGVPYAWANGDVVTFDIDFPI